MKDLSIRDDIILTKADKGAAVVIIDVDDYINKVDRQLNNQEFYKETPNDPTELNRKKVNNAIKELTSARLLDKKIATKLEVQEAKASAFYIFPKMYKPGNPGRLVKSSVNCHTTSISQYVDHNLQLHVKELKSYVKDSTDFIKKINNLGKIPENSILVTMDARSLHTNIPHRESIKAVETTLKRKNKPTRVIIAFLKLILTLNNFTFDCKNYLQIKGCVWELNSHLPTSIFLWECLKKTTFTI